MVKKVKTQKEKVLSIVKGSSGKGIFTPDVTLKALGQGVGCADRRLRELQEDGEVVSFRVEGNRTNLWVYEGYAN